MTNVNVNLIKVMKMLGYSEKVLKSMKTRYLAKVSSLSKEEATATVDAPIEITKAILAAIASGKGKAAIPANEMLTKLNTNPDKFTAEVDKVKVELKAPAAKVSDLKQEIDTLTKANEMLQERVAELMAENKELKELQEENELFGQSLTEETSDEITEDEMETE